MYSDGRPYKLHNFTRGDTESACQFALEDFEAINEYYGSDSPEWSASFKVWQLLSEINDARKSREKAWWWAAGIVFLMLATGRLILT
jgi:hypothetical protein